MILPPDKLQSHKALLKLWVGTLLKAITTRTEAPALRTLFLLDEAGQLGNFPFLETMITLSAGYGVWCWSFWQDLSQLKAAYPTSWENILNNCGVVQTFGIHNRNMAQQWGQFLGHDADALAALQPAEQVLSIHGEAEQRGRRMDYLSDACFAGRFDENRFFRRTNQSPPKLGPALEFLCNAAGDPIGFDLRQIRPPRLSMGGIIGDMLLRLQRFLPTTAIVRYQPPMPPMAPRYKVFVSYAHENNNSSRWVSQFVRNLRDKLPNEMRFQAEGAGLVRREPSQTPNDPVSG